MSDLNVIQFHSAGPSGRTLSPCAPLAPEGVADGNPEQHGHTYFTDTTGTLTAGVWTSTPYTETPNVCGVNEFMLVLEGSVGIVDDSGNETIFKTGDAFVMPKGMSNHWHQTEFMRKFYAIFDDPSGETADDPASPKLSTIERSVNMAAVGKQDESRYIGEVPEQHLLLAFSDFTKQMSVGVWDTTEMHTKPLPFVRNELMHLLEGSVTITNGDGVARKFSVGDTFLVPQGMIYQWDSDDYVKKIFCIFQPREALAKASGE